MQLPPELLELVVSRSSTLTLRRNESVKTMDQAASDVWAAGHILLWLVGIRALQVTCLATERPHVSSWHALVSCIGSGGPFPSGAFVPTRPHLHPDRGSSLRHLHRDGATCRGVPLTSGNAVPRNRRGQPLQPVTSAAVPTSRRAPRSSSGCHAFSLDARIVQMPFCLTSR